MACIAGEIHAGIKYEFHSNGIDESGDVTGDLKFSPAFTPCEFYEPDFVEIKSTDWSTGVLQIYLTDGNGTTKGSFRLGYNGQSSHIPILSAPAYRTVMYAREGNPEKANSVLGDHYRGSRADWNFRNDCRDTLTFECYVETLDALAGTSGEFDFVQFRSGLGYFAKRILDDIPQGIHSFEVLIDRVERWNRTNNLESVDLPEIIGEKLGRNWYRSGLSSERTELRDIGFPADSYDSDWKTVVPACWIAHIVLTEGGKEAQEYVANRPTASSTRYEELKSAAFEAGFGQRGPAWGRVVSLAGDTNISEFQFVASNYLNWTAKDYRGKSKFQAMLYAASATLLPDTVPARIKQEAEVNEQLAIGHAWRRDSAFKRAMEAFSRAKDIAQGETQSKFSIQPGYVVEAMANVAHMESKLISGADRQKNQNDRLDEGISDIREYGHEADVESDIVEHNVKFLEEQKQ